MVGLVQTTWKNRYLLENLDVIAATQAVGGGQHTSPTMTSPPACLPYKLSHRLGDETRKAIVEYYCQGHSSRDTAKRFAISKTAVLDLLRGGGVTPRPPHAKRIDEIKPKSI